MKQINVFDEIIVDNFAGGGGASTGAEMATGRSVDIAINHDPEAIAMHKANHPNTEHYCESVWDVDPIKACRGRKVGLAWFSPDCKHFSKAKGGKPKDKNIRALAWVEIKWAVAVRPRIMMLENVEEFRTWGPLDEEGNPIEERKGETFKALVDCLTTGLKDENHPAWDEIKECLGRYYSKKLLMKGLGYQAEWKELIAADFGAPTKRKRFFFIARCDGEAIIWPKPTHADRKSEEVMKGLLKPYVPAAKIIDWSIPCTSIFGRKKPLVENTVKRIAKGIKKFVIENPEPFIMQIGQTGFTEERNKSIHEPLTTIVSKAEHCLVAPFLTQYHSYNDNNVRGQAIGKPILTLDASNRYGLVATFLSKFYKPGIGQEVKEPIHTITTSPGHFGVIESFITTYYGNGGDIGQRIGEPLRTITARDRFGVVSVKISKIEGTNSLGNWNKIRDMLNKYCGYNLAYDEILLLNSDGIYYFIYDLGLRMLGPRELFNGNGFPENYIIEHDDKGKPYPKRAQVARCGNAVPPPFAEALVRANLPEFCDSEDTGRYSKVV